jgi:hypothetical protein
MSPRRAFRQSVDSAAADWIGDLPPTFLACRDMGHAWRPQTASFESAARQYRRVLRCQRCKADRVQYLSMRGHVESTHYVYPDGYTRPAGAEFGPYDSAMRDVVHLTAVTRLVEDSHSVAS